MNNNSQIESDKVLNSLDNCKRATVPDFFYTRLKARMERDVNKGENRSWILRPAYALGGLAFLLVINTIVILQKDETEINDATADTETVQSAAEYYSLNDNNVYEIMQEK